jgi:hypothetical protein
MTTDPIELAELPEIHVGLAAIWAASVPGACVPCPKKAGRILRPALIAKCLREVI